MSPFSKRKHDDGEDVVLRPEVVAAACAAAAKAGLSVQEWLARAILASA
jgi:hypothetical protein